MVRTDHRSVDDYLAAQPEAVRELLGGIRDAIRQALPEAQEAISYQIPAYKVEGAAALFFAGWKRHYSLYPATAELVAAFRDELAAYEVEKGTIRFPLTTPAPLDLIARIARFRAGQVVEERKRWAAAKKL